MSTIPARMERLQIQSQRRSRSPALPETAAASPGATEHLTRVTRLEERDLLFHLD